MEKRYKRLLVISHNCFSTSGSNGRTLRNYILGWPQDKLAQLYIHNEKPDFDICNKYYCITDKEILESIQNRKSAGHEMENTENRDVDVISRTNSKKIKNSAIFLAREIAWNSRLWNRKGLNQWLDRFRPEIILVQAGDAGFLFRIAEQVKKRYSAEIVIYNTEGYYFKKCSYLLDNKITKCLYPIVHWNFKRAYNSLVKNSKAQIYNCDFLRKDYEDVFHTNSFVVMNASEFTEQEIFNPKKRRFIYAGNLGLKRYESLIEFADVLHDIDNDLIIDVYGKMPNQNVENKLKKCDGIRILGMIPYEKLKKEIAESQYLLHIESFDQFYKEDLKYAFSTKIADSLATGACLFVYAPENMAVIQYLKEKEAAILITNQGELKTAIKESLEDKNKNKNICFNGRNLAEKNHNIKKNRQKFQQILLGIERGDELESNAN